MRSRKTTAVLAFLIPLGLGAMASGWVPLLPAMENEFGISRTALSLAPLGGLIAGLVAGPLVDWKGSRPLIVVGGLVAALGLLILSAASSLPIALTGGFLASTGVGLAGGIVIQVLVANWFVQYRGTILGLALAGSGLGSLLFAPVVGLVAAQGSWRVAVVLSAPWGIGVAVAGFALIHSFPAKGEEDDLSKVRVPGRRSPQLERIVPLGQYLRSPRLWRALTFLALASAGVVWASSGLSVTARWLVHDVSGSEAAAEVVVRVFGIGSAVGGLVWGVGADFWERNRMLWWSESGAVVVLALLGVIFLFSPGAVGLGALLFLAAVFLGGLGALIGLTFIDYMGVRLLGTLSVAFGLLANAGGPTGPLVTGLVFDAFGPSWWFPMGALVVAVAVLAATNAPYPNVVLERPAMEEV